MPLDINAFRSIASQSPDKLVYVQGESLKTTRNQAHHAAHTYKAATDAFLAAYRQHYGAILGDALKRHLEAEGNAGKPLTARTIKALVAFADEKIGSATHVDAAGRSVKLDEVGTDDLSRVGWSQAGKIAKAEAGQKNAAAATLAALKFGPDGKVDLEAMLRTHIADLSRNAHRQPPSYNVFMAADPENILDVEDRSAFRDWLAANHETATECWIAVKRGRPVDDGVFYYLDAVEEALCFGWIDSIHKVIDGVRMQRFSPRKPRSPWTELNKERVRRLERLDLMTDAGRAVLPAMGPRSFRIDPDIERALKDARVWSKFKSFPSLYQRVRAYNVAFYKKRGPQQYAEGLESLIAHTRRGEMYGEWNDYGRLT